MEFFAVVRVRGQVRVKSVIEKTLRLLRLYKKNNCVVIPATNDYMGLINKVKDYVTWGELSKETFKKLLMQRGKLVGNKRLSEAYLVEHTKKTFDAFVNDFFEEKIKLKDIPGFKLWFRLQPPRFGFESKGIKKPYSIGGALGYRGKHINELIERMI